MAKPHRQMRMGAFQLALSLVLVLTCSARAQEPAAPNYEFKNGRWFNGQSFEKGTWYAVDGRLSKDKPKGNVDEVDLQGGYVVPPFAEAHNHNVDAGASDMIRRYIREGIFYVKNPNSLPNDRTALIAANLINTPQSIDVVFAHGGLTVTNGHPIQIAKRNIDNGWWKASDAMKA